MVAPQPNNSLLELRCYPLSAAMRNFVQQANLVDNIVYNTNQSNQIETIIIAQTKTLDYGALGHDVVVTSEFKFI